MKSSFPSHPSAASAVRVQQTAHSSLWGTVPRIIFWQVISAATQYNAAGQRSVYEAGIYKVKLDRSSAESTSRSRSVLSLTDPDGWLTRSPTWCPGPQAALLQSAAPVCQSVLTSGRKRRGHRDRQTKGHSSVHSGGKVMHTCRHVCVCCTYEKGAVTGMLDAQAQLHVCACLCTSMELLSMCAYLHVLMSAHKYIVMCMQVDTSTSLVACTHMYVHI